MKILLTIIIIGATLLIAGCFFNITSEEFAIRFNSLSTPVEKTATETPTQD